MGRGQVLFISVEGDDNAITEGLKAFQSGMALIQRKSEEPAAVEIAPSPPAALPGAKAAEVEDLAESISRRTVSRAVAKVRRSVEAKAAGDGFKCRFCDKVCAAQAATGRHESKEHPAEYAAAGPVRLALKPDLVTVKNFNCDGCGRKFRLVNGLKRHAAKCSAKVSKIPGAGKKYVPCGQNGCFKEFVSTEAREKHWERDHS